MRIEVLGSVQDGGVPHLGCDCEQCSAARKDRNLQRYATSIKVYDEDREVNYIFDASADIRHQLGDQYLDGVFITHAHMGHIIGLLYLGRESMNANMVNVYCSENVRHYMENNTDYQLLIDRNNIHVDTFRNGDTIELMGMTVEPVEALHRYVPTDYHAFRMVTDSGMTVLYLPELDEWTEDAEAAVRDADIAFLDGTFWSTDEIDRYERVPHITIRDSIDRLQDADTEIYFIHMNHTNPVIDAAAEERQQVEEAGMHIAEEGLEIEL